ncbi:MAG: hypothetical protein JWM89_1749, partial [Acidimicrobiales bacterium]|nr:hypothetical protein [Acidimicrobiales bacterium]
MGGLIVFWLLCGVVGGLMGTSKPKIGGAGGFFLGALLGPLGLLVILASKGHPDAPPPTALQRIQRRPEAVGQGWHPDPLGRFDSRWWDG